MVAEFGTGQVFWSMLWFSLFVIWIWLLIVVFGDIFRSRDLSGSGKALWSIFIVVVPYFGVFVYLIVHGQKMHERSNRTSHPQDAARGQYVQSGGSSAEEIDRLAQLREQGAITEAEFQQAKAKTLS